MGRTFGPGQVVFQPVGHFDTHFDAGDDGRNDPKGNDHLSHVPSRGGKLPFVPWMGSGLCRRLRRCIDSISVWRDAMVHLSLDMVSGRECSVPVEALILP